MIKASYCFSPQNYSISINRQNIYVFVILPLGIIPTPAKKLFSIEFLPGVGGMGFAEKLGQISKIIIANMFNVNQQVG